MKKIDFLMKVALCSVFVMAGTICSEGQTKDSDTSDWLRMEGVITELKILTETNGVDVYAKVKLTIRNISDKSVFLYRKDFSIVGDKLALSLEDDRKYIFAYSMTGGAGSSYGSPESAVIRAVTVSMYGIATTGEPAGGVVGGDEEEGFF